MSVLRVGHGFDVHRFSGDPGRPLVLGGVTIPEVTGLVGHSDADVVTHAVADALLGAASLGDLGGHFPDTDPKWAGADSLILLRQVVEMIASKELRTLNADCTVVCERPRLAPYTPAMQETLSEILGAPVSVKAKRAEEMGALGRVEGIACFAVALVCSAQSDLS